MSLEAPKAAAHRELLLLHVTVLETQGPKGRLRTAAFYTLGLGSRPADNLQASGSEMGPLEPMVPVVPKSYLQDWI